MGDGRFLFTSGQDEDRQKSANGESELIHGFKDYPWLILYRIDHVPHSKGLKWSKPPSVEKEAC